jgi:hypothetical protein
MNGNIRFEDKIEPLPRPQVGSVVQINFVALLRGVYQTTRNI